jgi:hypothetical protein
MTFQKIIRHEITHGIGGARATLECGHTVVRKEDSLSPTQQETLMPPKPCRSCGGTGKADRGNGSTKPCYCDAGIAESARRRALRDAKRSELPVQPPKRQRS